MTRRGAVAAVIAMAGIVFGRSRAQAQGPVMQLILDGTEGVLVTYRGQQVLVRPQEIIEALRDGGYRK